MTIEFVPDLADPVEATREAWGHVADGYLRALQVRGLETIEADALRESLRCCYQIINERPVKAVRTEA